ADAADSTDFGSADTESAGDDAGIIVSEPEQTDAARIDLGEAAVLTEPAVAPEAIGAHGAMGVLGIADLNDAAPMAADTAAVEPLDTPAAHAALDGLCSRVDMLAKDVERAVAAHASKDDVRLLTDRFDQFEMRLEEMQGAPLDSAATGFVEEQITGLVGQVEKIGAEASRIEVLEDALAQVIDEVTGLRGELPSMVGAPGAAGLEANTQDALAPLYERLDTVQDQVGALGTQLADIAQAVSSNTETVQAAGADQADGKLDQLQSTLDQLAQRFAHFASQVEVVDDEGQAAIDDAPMAPPLAGAPQTRAGTPDEPALSAMQSAPMHAAAPLDTAISATSEMYGQEQAYAQQSAAHATDEDHYGTQPVEAAPAAAPVQQEDRAAEKDAFIAAARRAAQVARERLGRSKQADEAEAAATASGNASVQSALARVLSPGQNRAAPGAAPDARAQSQGRMGDPALAAAAASAAKPKRRSLFSFGRSDPKPVLIVTTALLLTGGLGFVVAGLTSDQTANQVAGTQPAALSASALKSEVGAAALLAQSSQRPVAAQSGASDAQSSGSQGAARDIAQALNNGLPISDAAYTLGGTAAQTTSVNAPAALDLPPDEAGPLKRRMAAANGDPSAQYDVAARLAVIGQRKAKTGNGGRLIADAAKWFLHAAKADYAPAQYRLATHYERGLGVERNMNEARVWYGRAARNGNVRAMHNVAVLAASANETADYGTAAEWFSKAAAYGLSDSQFNLAILQQAGLGLERDLHKAYHWFSIAARSGDAEAKRRRDLVRMSLDSETLAKLDAGIAIWQPRPAASKANRVPVVAGNPKGKPNPAPRNGGKLVSQAPTAPVSAPAGAIGTPPAAAARYQMPGVSPVLASFAQPSGQIETIKAGESATSRVARAQRALAKLGFQPGAA
ncbi:MAG: tetratricopeptide repeat protein, partial [Pseudomonadota bacterium]